MNKDKNYFTVMKLLSQLKDVSTDLEDEDQVIDRMIEDIKSSGKKIIKNQS